MSEPTPTPADLARIVARSSLACLTRTGESDDWLASPGLVAALGLDPRWTSSSEEGWAKHVHADDLKAWQELLQWACAGGEGHTLRLRHQDGTWLWFHCESVVEAEHRLLLCTDRTQLKQVEAALLDSQMRLHSLYDVAPLAIILWSREGRITDWNQAAAASFGHSRDDALGRKFVALLIDPADYAAFSAAVSEALQLNRTSTVTCRCLTASGTALICEWWSVPMRSAKGNLVGIFSLAVDVTAKQAASEALRGAKAAAEALSQARSEFIATIGHELRTPLNGILGMAQMLQDLPMEPEQKEFVDLIHASGKTLLDIVNGILDYTEVDSANATARMEPFSPRESAAIVAERHAFAAQRKGLAFDVDIGDGVPDAVSGDGAGIERILGILLDNAVKFTDAGGVRLKIWGEPADGSAVTLSFQVSDTGIGMDDAFLEQIHKPFRQAENAITRKKGGVGLGLALARKLADRCGGDLAVESRAAQGTTFVLKVRVSACG